MRYGVNSKNETIRGMFETIEAAEAVAIKSSRSRAGVEWRVTTAHDGETIVVSRFVNGERTGSPSAAPEYSIKGDVATIVGAFAKLTTAEAIAAERQRVADVLAEVARGLDGRAASCDGIAGDCDLRMRKIAETLPIDTSAVETEWETRVRVMGKSAAYEHAAELVRAEFATIGASSE